VASAELAARHFGGKSAQFATNLHFPHFELSQKPIANSQPLIPNLTNLQNLPNLFPQNGFGKCGRFNSGIQLSTQDLALSTIICCGTILPPPQTGL